MAKRTANHQKVTGKQYFENEVQVDAELHATGNTGLTAGSGITSGTGTVYHSWIERFGGIIKTSIYIDVTGLNSAAGGDIIGDDAAANCHIGQYTVAKSGTLVAGKITCLETPDTGDHDIDIYSATESTGTENDAVSGLTETAVVTAAGDWIGGGITGMVSGFVALPAANEYLYLVNGGGTTNATYAGGKFLIELFGTA